MGLANEKGYGMQLHLQLLIDSDSDYPTLDFGMTVVPKA